MTRTRVFAGLSVRGDEVGALLPAAEVYPPARRGDAHRAMDDGVHVLLLVDGFFEQVAAVSIGELMDALRTGMSLHGSSSMGALRAAELATYGMRGHGLVYDLVTTTPRFSDDLVAQAMTTDGNGVHPVSQAWVDFHFNVRREVEGRRASLDQAELLEHHFAGLDYTRRTRAHLLARLKADLVRDPGLAAVVDAGCALERSQKRLDAELMLRVVAEELRRVSTLNQRLCRAFGSVGPGGARRP